MPVMDGETATQVLRERGLETPIIALTANAMKGFEAKILEIGCTEYLTKPVDIDELMKTLGKLLNGKFTPAVELQNSPSLAKGPLRLPESDLDSSPIISRYLESGPRFRPIVQRFVDKLDEILIAFRTASEQQDFVKLAELAHWLKGSGGTVGFDEFTEPAAFLEQAAKQGAATMVDAIIVEITQLASRIHMPARENEDVANVRD